MIRLIKFECYKLSKDKLFFTVTILILMINFIMFSGQSISVELLAQKMFLTIVIASIYGVSFNAKDYEDRKISFEILSGNSRIKILMAKLFVTNLCIQAQLLIFPIFAGFIYHTITDRSYVMLLVMYLELGFFLTIMAALLTILLKNQGLSIGCAIVLHFIALLSVNSSSYGYMMSHIIPIGMIQLVLNHYMTLPLYTINLLVWDLFMLILASISVEKTDF